MNPEQREVKAVPQRKRGIILPSLLLLILAAVSTLIYIEWKGMKSGQKDQIVYDHEAYYAIILDSDQVYFGKVETWTPNELILANAYYLATNGGVGAVQNIASPPSQFTLMDVTDQIYSPTNKVILNPVHILSLQQLEEDSRVVESIKKALK